MCQDGVTRLAGVAFMAKSSKAKHVCLKLCTFPSRLTAEITRNRNEHTRSVKCPHFGIFSIVNRTYLVSQTIPYKVLSQRFLAGTECRNYAPSSLTKAVYPWLWRYNLSEPICDSPTVSIKVFLIILLATNSSRSRELLFLRSSLLRHRTNYRGIVFHKFPLRLTI